MSTPALSYEVDANLELRAVVEADAEPLFALVEANRAHLRAWLPWLDATTSVDDVRAFIDRSRQQAARNDGVQYAIFEGGTLIGMIGHVGINWPNRSTEIGYWLAEDAQGRGIITRSVGALVDEAFGLLGLHRVVIRCATGNVRSAAVPRRLGFTLEGTLREAERLYDHYLDMNVYAMLASEWRTRA